MYVTAPYHSGLRAASLGKSYLLHFLSILSSIALLYHRLGLSRRAHPQHHVYSSHSLSRALTVFFFLSALTLALFILSACLLFSYCFPQEPCVMVEGREGVCLVQGFTVELN